MSCIEKMKYTILLQRIGFKEAREYIEKNSEEVYYVFPWIQNLQRLLYNRSTSHCGGDKGQRSNFSLYEALPWKLCSEYRKRGQHKRDQSAQETGEGKVTAPSKKGNTPESSKAPLTSYEDMWKK